MLVFEIGWVGIFRRMRLIGRKRENSSHLSAREKHHLNPRRKRWRAQSAGFAFRRFGECPTTGGFLSAKNGYLFLPRSHFLWPKESRERRAEESIHSEGSRTYAIFPTSLLRSALHAQIDTEKDALTSGAWTHFKNLSEPERKLFLVSRDS